MVSSTRRSISAFCATALAASFPLSAVGVAHAETPPNVDPAEAAASWLVDALVDGERIQSEFDGEFHDSPGVTADTVVALAAVGVASASIETATDWLETQAESYSGLGDDVSAGAIGKLLLVAATTDRDPHAFGGVDLVAEVEAVEVTEPDAGDPEDLLGRYRDVSEFGDFSTPLTHALVLLGLERTSGATPSDAATEVLLDQQCDDGGFSEVFLLVTEDDPEPACTSSVDTTSYAVQALDALGEDAAVASAVDWLEGVQADDGSFGSADGQNTNSSGLAALALSVGDGDRGAIDDARAYIAGQQDGCDDEAPGSIPFNAGERGFVALATAQAIPGLVGVSLAEVSASGAVSEVPALDCADDAEPVDDDADDADGDDGSTGDASDEEQEDDEQEIEQPTRIDSGLSPSGPRSGTTLAMLAMLAGAALLAAVATRRRGHDRG